MYFQGLEIRGGLTGWQVERGEYDDRNLKLVDVAMASLRRKYNVDEDRVYATGFSNGAMFTYLLWAERPAQFAAYAPVAGRLRPSVQPKQRRPLFHVAGERDPQVTFTDQKAAIAIAIGVNGVRDKSTRCGDGCTALWIRHAGSGDDLDSPGRPHLSAGHHSADRVLLSRSSTEALSDLARIAGGSQLRAQGQAWAVTQAPAPVASDRTSSPRGRS